MSFELVARYGFHVHCHRPSVGIIGVLRNIKYLPAYLRHASQTFGAGCACLFIASSVDPDRVPGRRLSV